ncbi:MAG TPA: histidine phosphatase family protein [Azospirillaceae bacterium]|nr:histidine phosphatase family protein [Azospirillaceae bacterium]
MTHFLLVRHGSHDLLGSTLAGRMEGVGLSASGREEAERLAGVLERAGITRLLSSPVQRCRETAAIIATRIRVPVEPTPEVTEVDFGEWTGRRFAELEGDPRWLRWNAFRSGAVTPGGESMQQVQLRMVTHLERIRREEPTGTVAVIGHADPIRATLAWALGMTLDLMLRLEVAPASLSRLELAEWGVRVLSVNERVPAA